MNEHEEQDEDIEEDDEDEICSWCSGSGEGMYDGSTCQKCRGSGVEPKEKKDDYYE
jgi:DnaJ-class molecular chaperone